MPPELTRDTKSIAYLRSIIDEIEEQQQPKNDDVWTVSPPIED